MASKHLFPGHQFSARSRKWTPRLKVTEDSLRLMVCRVQSLDHCCNQSKVRCNTHGKCGCEGSSSDKIWSSGDDRLDMELHAALPDREDDFKIVKNMPCFKGLLGYSLFKAPVSSAQEESFSLKRDEYDHLIKNLEYDCKVYDIWQKKCQGVTMARQHARQEHLVAQHKNCLQSVGSFVDGCVRFMTWENCKTSKSLIPQILKFRLDSIQKMLGKEIHASSMPDEVLACLGVRPG